MHSIITITYSSYRIEAELVKDGKGIAKSELKETLKHQFAIYSEYLRTQVIYRGKKTIAINFQLSNESDLHKAFVDILKKLHTLTSKGRYHVAIFKYACILFDENKEAKLFTASNNTKFYKMKNISAKKIRNVEHDANLLTNAVDVACNDWYANSSYTFGMVASVQVDLMFY